MASPNASPSPSEQFERWEFVLAEGTFEESLETLEALVARLEEGQLSLNESLRCYELGVLISRRCEKMIDEAELRISRLSLDDLEEIDDPLDEEPYETLFSPRR